MEGIQARMETNMPYQTSGDKLWFKIDLRNNGKLEHVGFDTFQGPRGIRIDGVPIEPNPNTISGGSHMFLELPPGTTTGWLNCIRSVVFKPQYFVGADGSSPFVLSLGKHTLSCPAYLLCDPGKNARYIAAYTAPLEIEIISAAKP
jgi:hypothetical protein